MSLRERLQRQGKNGETEQAGSAPPQGDVEAEDEDYYGDPLLKYKARITEALFVRLGNRLYDPSLTEDQLGEYVVEELTRAVEEDGSPLSQEERERLVAAISDDVLRYGPIEPFLGDPAVTEVMVNAIDSIYVEIGGRLHLSEARFISEEHLRRIIGRIVAMVGRRIDESSPMVDARLADGSRVNAIIPPLAVDGPVLTIRKFAADPFQAHDLVEFGTLSPAIRDFLDACVSGRLNILITGGTGTGKTTLLNVVSSFIQSDQRIVTIEDAVELQLHQAHVIRLESRPPNIEGKGAIAIRDLVRNALRMRPDRILVGEVRGAESLDMLQAMNTGHDGSLSTLHANSPRDGLSRLETMVQMAGMDIPSKAVREQIASAIDLIVHLQRFPDGSRRITHVTEISGMEGNVISLQDIFLFDWNAGIDKEGHHLGKAEPTGIRPKFTDRLAAVGIELPPELFDAETVG